ncbi:MAG: O-antigen ligase family protein [Chloroflexi bacterium]|nr:O-antigen ligase family protein [Chloroflexota bacterium]
MSVLFGPQRWKAPILPQPRPHVLVTLIGALAALIGGALIGAVSPILGSIAVIATLVGIVVLINDEVTVLAVVLTITLLPFATLPINVGLSPTFLDSLCGLLLLRWLARRVNPRWPASPSTPVDWVVWLWLGIALIALLAASGRAPLTGDTLHTFVKIVLATLLFFFVVDVIRTRDQFIRLVAIFCFSTTVAALGGLFLYFIHPSTANRILKYLGVLHYPTSGDVLRYRVDFNHAERAISTSIDPNVFGGLLMVANLLLVGQLFARKPLWDRRLSMIALVPMMLTQLLTYSRSSWVGLFIGLVTLGVLRYRKLLLLGIIAAILFLSLPVTHRFSRQLVSGLEAKDQAAAMRLGEAKDALRLISVYPTLGVGFGGSPDINFYVGVSNIFLLMAEEMGIIGLAVFALVLLILFIWMLYSLPRMLDPPLQDVLAGLIGVFMAIGAAGMLDRYFFSFQSDIGLMWMLFALMFVCGRIGRQPAPEPVVHPLASPAVRTGHLQVRSSTSVSHV